MVTSGYHIRHSKYHIRHSTAAKLALQRKRCLIADAAKPRRKKCSRVRCREMP
jgi:hypothetical protein